jgi:ribosomal protein S18 acetylase RimI-like enzyme
MIATIREISAAEVRRCVDGLAHLLADSVNLGAAIGFLAPLPLQEARLYWEGVVDAMEGGSRILLIAELNGKLVGTVQLALAQQKNGAHRAEVMKLIVDPAARGQGIGTALMLAIEKSARRQGRSLLVLDTRVGDSGERLYRSLGYVAAGIIPRYAFSSDGSLHGTTIFYKEIDDSSETV